MKTPTTKTTEAKTTRRTFGGFPATLVGSGPARPGMRLMPVTKSDRSRSR